MAKPKRTVQHQTFVYVDLVCLTIRDRELQVLTVERETADKGMLALPGGLLEDSEGLAEAAVRELHEETGISVSPQSIHQIGAYGDPQRDTRFGRAISIAYLALVPHPDRPLPGSDARGSGFVPFALTQRKGTMEFDHRDIIRDAHELALRLIEDTPIATQFCGKNFTMTDLRNVYEAILGYTVDPANFRKKIEAVDGFVVQVPNLESTHSGAGRPAKMYRRGSLRELNPPVRFRLK
jgi:8-oxo-dGTP diphosphatase